MVATRSEKKTSVPMHKTKNDLPEVTRSKMVQLGNQLLADVFDLQSQAKQAHWNVKGMSFIALHELFDELAGELAVFIDDIAERVTALGGTALGTVRVAAKQSRLSEYPLDITEGKDHVKALSDSFAKFGSFVRDAIDESEKAGDADSADLYTGISRQVDKQLWFLEAHIQ